MSDVMDPPTVKFQRDIFEILAENSSVPSFRGGHYSFLQISQLLELGRAYPNLIKDKRIIDFGCGAARPIASSALLYLLGASSTLAIDLERPFDPAAVAVANYGNIIAVISGVAPIDFTLSDVDISYARSRAADFDLAGLLQGELYESLPRAVNYRVCRYQDLTVDEKKFDLMISSSVFEHVADIEDVLTDARQAISTSGYIYTSVDFRDHRLYSQGLSPWQYLLDGGDHEPNYINKIRYTSMVAVFNRTGFEIVSSKIVREELPPSVDNELLPEYRMLSTLDKEAVEARFLLRPK